MIDLLKKALKAPFKVNSLLSISPVESEIFQYVKNIPKDSRLPAESVVVQSVEDPYYFALFGLILSSVAKHKPLHIDQLVFNSLILGESQTLNHTIKFRFANRLLRKKWVGLYSAFCEGIAYRSTGFQTPISDIIDFFRACKTWRNLSTKDELIKLTVDNIPIGDLVNDSYLRFKPAPTVILKDYYLLLVIWQAYRDIRRALTYFMRVRPEWYLTSYTTYIQHGIATRVALMRGVRVFSFGNHQEFAKQLSQNDWFHARNTDSYAQDFTLLSDQENNIGLADIALNARISGKIDNATSYMKQSAYAKTNEPVPDVKGAIIIFLHDFYDSPHVYPDMVFPDFWEWVCFTIETLENEGISYFIKPHPNQIHLSDSVLLELKQRYPNTTLLSSRITNKQLVEAGMACAVTVHGTVAHEMAYMGIPTIACTHHPHISFDFCKTAKNRIDYALLLKNFKQFIFDKAEMKRQSLIFYYMHNLNLSEDDKMLVDAIIKLHQFYGKSGSQETGNQADLFQDIVNCLAFNRFISGLV